MKLQGGGGGGGGDKITALAIYHLVPEKHSQNRVCISIADPEESCMDQQ